MGKDGKDRVLCEGVVAAVFELGFEGWGRIGCWSRTWMLTMGITISKAFTRSISKTLNPSNPYPSFKS